MKSLVTIQDCEYDEDFSSVMELSNDRDRDDHLVIEVKNESNAAESAEIVVHRDALIRALFLLDGEAGRSCAVSLAFTHDSSAR